MKFHNIDRILNEANKRQCTRLLFDFECGNTVLKCLLIVPNKVLMLSCKNQAVGCSIAINTNGKFDAYLPNEFYNAIRNDVATKFDKDVTSMWEFFDKYLLNLDIDKVSEPTNSDIMNIIKTIRTNNKKYRTDGEKLYFMAWVRNGKKHISDENYKKISKFFGMRIANLCKKQNVSSRWSNTFQKIYLDFLDLDKAKKAITKK